MEVITCPQTDDRQDDDLPRIFMAGGISGCPPWQDAFLETVAKVPAVFYNPRRPDFNSTDLSMTKEQIKWEVEHLDKADAMIFWFPCETLCPITLFELGKYAQKGKTLFVGCHPDYARKLDVEEQLALMRIDIVVRNNIAMVIQDMTNWIARRAS